MRIAILFLCLINTANADALLKSAITVHAVDWLQTREIARNDNFYENNIVLGESPSLTEVDAYMASTLVIMTTIDFLLPKKHKGAFRFLWLSMGSAYALSNYSIGIKLKL